MHALRPNRSLAISVALILLLGLAGLWAGVRAGDQAVASRRSDRLALQETLAGLTGQYTQVAGAEILDILGAQNRAGAGAWSGIAGRATDLARLRRVATGSRALGAGAVLVGPTGVPVGSFTPPGRALPEAKDPGWTPLRAAVLSARRTLPVSGVLKAGTDSVVAVAVPVPFADGTTGLLVGLSDLKRGALQKYVEQLVNKDGRRGYVIDSQGLVIAAPTAAEVGRPLRFPAALRMATTHRVGISDVLDGGTRRTVSYARARDTTWTALTVQDTDLFLGPLRTASRRAQVALVLLLLSAGSALLVVHRKRETALQDVALSDELTGLYNRRGWFAVASHELERGRRSGERRGLIFVDVDGLKQVNDALGHREGDRAIAGAADVLRSCARGSDVLGRLGGDEFVLLLGEDSAPGVVRQRVLDALAAYNSGSGARFELRLSIGAEVWYPDSAMSLDELVRRADGEMYADKSARPGRHEGVVRPVLGGFVQRQHSDREVHQ